MSCLPWRVVALVECFVRQSRRRRRRTQRTMLANENTPPLKANFARLCTIREPGTFEIFVHASVSSVVLFAVRLGCSWFRVRILFNKQNNSRHTKAYVYVASRESRVARLVVCRCAAHQ